MKVRKILTCLLIAVMVSSLLFGCGARGGSVSMEEAAQPEGMDSLAKPSAGTVMPENQKLIRKIRLNAETRNMDDLLIKIDAKVAELGGYIESRKVYNGSNFNYESARYAVLTIRVPAKDLDAFVTDISEKSNIVSTDETTENITLSYIAVESKMKALETEQTRLLVLLEQAKNMDEILQIESRLTTVRTQLEEVTSQLRLYDNLVDYGTIYLNLDEVREYTEVEEEPEGFWARIGKGFVKSLKNLGIILRELVIFAIVCLPYLVIPAVVLVVILIFRKKRKKKNQKNNQPNDQ